VELSDGYTIQVRITVPSAADCGSPVWLDLHPSYYFASNSDIDAVHYVDPDTAAQMGAILVSPLGEYTSGNIEWTGDPSVWADRLVELLSTQQLDDHPLWVSGLEGSTPVAGHLLTRGLDLQGIAVDDLPVDDDIPWAPWASPPRIALRPRVYLGPRQSLEPTALLDALGHPTELRFVDEHRDLFESDGLLQRAYSFAFLGRRPGPPPDASPGWTEVALGQTSLLTIDPTSTALRVGTGAGEVRTHDTTQSVSDTSPVIGLCGDTAALLDGVVELNSGDQLLALPFVTSLSCGSGALAAGGDDVATAIGGQPWAIDESASAPWYVATAVLGDRVALGSITGNAAITTVDGLTELRDLVLDDTTVHDFAWSDEVLLGVTAGGEIVWSHPPFDELRRTFQASDTSLHAVALDGDRAVAVGHGGRVFVSADQGDTWTGLGVGRDVTLHDVRLNGDTIEAVGAGGAVFSHPWPL
jgi:hypothetical protein